MRSLSTFVRALCVAAAVALAACSSTGDEKFDETRDWSAERLYTEAKSELISGAYKKAVEYYQKLEARYPYGKYAQQAKLEMAYAYYKDAEPVLALAEADRFIKLYPDHPSVDYAYYLKGLVNFNENLGLLGSLARQDLSERDQQASRDAYQSFRQITVQFPESKYAPDAALRMNYIVNSLASYEVHVARYYYRRGAYVAAANRAQQAVQEFQRAPATEEALYIMALSYDKLGLPQLRDDAQRVLTSNFPESRFVKSGFAAPEKPWWQLW